MKSFKVTVVISVPYDYHQWRLVFRLDDQRSPHRITVIAVEDYH